MAAPVTLQSAEHARWIWDQLAAQTGMDSKKVDENMKMVLAVDMLYCEPCKKSTDLFCDADGDGEDNGECKPCASDDDEEICFRRSEPYQLSNSQHSLQTVFEELSTGDNAMSGNWDDIGEA